jgi:hypothetical protein
MLDVVDIKRQSNCDNIHRNNIQLNALEGINQNKTLKMEGA